jgi:uncharacterized protein YjbI with pentapeptide repeats
MIENKNRLIISNQTFSNESDLDQYLKWDAFPLIDFVDCRFEDLDLLGKVFGSCNFENCKFNDVSLRKCQFSNCNLKNCHFVKSDLSRAEFSDTSFRNCEFLKSNLQASDFRRCELFQIKFKSSNLNLIGAQSVKVSNSKHSIEIEESSNLEKILKDKNFIRDPD